MATTEPKTHDLKCWPEYFEAVADGRKPFEIREDDRGYLKGDILHLREWCPQTEQYTGQSCQRQVTYILRSSTHNQIEYSVRRNFVVMGLADPQHPLQVESDRIRNAAAKQEQAIIDILGPLLGFPTGPFPEVCSECQGGPCTQVEKCSTYCLSAPYVAEELAATVAKELVAFRGKDEVRNAVAHVLRQMRQPVTTVMSGSLNRRGRWQHLGMMGERERNNETADTLATCYGVDLGPWPETTGDF